MIAMMQVLGAVFHHSVFLSFKNFWQNEIAFLIVTLYPMLWFFLGKTWSWYIVRLPGYMSEKNNYIPGNKMLLCQ